MGKTQRKPCGGFHEDGILEECVAGRRAREEEDSVLDITNLENLTKEKNIAALLVVSGRSWEGYGLQLLIRISSEAKQVCGAGVEW